MEQDPGDPLLWGQNLSKVRRFISQKEIRMQPMVSPVGARLSLCISIAVVVVTIGLPGCANVDNFFKEQREAKELKQVKNARESCKRYGFTENTDAFAQCIQNDVNAAKARQVAEEPPAPAASRRISTSCTKTLTGTDCTTR